MRAPQIIRRHPRNGLAQPLPDEPAGDSVDLDLLATAELDMLVRGLARSVRAQAGLLAVSDGSGEVVEVLGTWGNVLSLEGFPTSLTDRFLGRAFASERAVLEPIGAPGEATLTGSGLPLTHAATASVKSASGKLTGALCAFFSAAPSDDEEEMLRLVESYARLASLCLTEPRVLEDVLAAAKLDGLTGCLNYSALRHELEREIRRSERHGLSLTCCFVDLDEFKLVNNNYGHMQGSALLVEVAKALQSMMRSEDTLGRYGGDEFVAILPETDESEGVMLAHRIRSALAAPATKPTSGDVDASIGVAQWQSGTSSADLLEAAELALRLAKQSGGGTVIGASELRASPHAIGSPGAAPMNLGEGKSSPAAAAGDQEGRA